jgi:hypothetical protein
MGKMVTGKKPPVATGRVSFLVIPPQPSSVSQGSLVRAVSKEKLVQNLLLNTPYRFKKSYGSTPEPQTAQDAPWLRGPSLKILLHACRTLPQCVRDIDIYF